jgi:general secretion pathway protein G
MTKRQSIRYLALAVGLVALLVWFAIMHTSPISRVRPSNALNELRVLAAELELIASQTGRYPTPDEFAKRVEQNNWNPEVRVDPWGKTYQYRLLDSDGTRYELFSFGADGVLGGAGPDADIYAAPPSIVIGR